MEVWRDIPDYAGRYQVSDQGRVRSLLFRGNGGAQVMKSSTNYAGYHVISLGKDRKQHRVHCLVLLAFVGPRPTPDHDGCHRDSDKNNNHLSNLRWDTKSGNIKDRRSYFGDGNPNAKLNQAQREEIARRARAGESRTILARAFGITVPRVCQIAKG